MNRIHVLLCVVVVVWNLGCSNQTIDSVDREPAKEHRQPVKVNWDEQTDFIRGGDKDKFKRDAALMRSMTPQQRREFIEKEKAGIRERRDTIRPRLSR